MVPSFSVLAGALWCFVFYRLLRFLYNEWTSPLQALPGPPSRSFIFGNLKEIWNAKEPGIVEEKWLEEYGPAIKYKGFLGMNQLFTADPKVLNHIMMNTYDYQKSASVQRNMEQIVGPGLLTVEADRHKRQRRVMNSVFGPAQVRDLTSIFVEKALQVRDAWSSQIQANDGDVTRVDALSWMGKAALDIVGLAGFHYQFDALSNQHKENELHVAFSTIFRTSTKFSLMALLSNVVPSFHFLSSGKFKQAAGMMSRIGNRLLEESKAGLAGDPQASSSVSWTGRDLLSMLVRANFSKDLPPSQRMSDEDVIAQIATFIVTGHETISTATTWGLYALTQNPESQSKLREEALRLGSDQPTMDELNALPYLDSFVRETLRLYPPIPSKTRVAMKDDILTLSKPIKDKNGCLIDHISIKKGQPVSIPIILVNRLKSIWGDDAHQFRPERWQTLPKSVDSVPGVWGNTLTFFGGPHSCIAYRFALVEIKALLFTLVKAFEFDLAVPPGDLIKKTNFALRPMLASNPKAGNTMPLFIKPYEG